MENQKKKQRKRNKTYSAKKRNKRYQCIKCSNVFYSIIHFRRHVNDNPSCCSDFCCNFCNFIGYNEISLNSHLTCNPSCQHKYHQSKVATGILPDSFHKRVELPNSSPYTTSFVMDKSQLPSSEQATHNTILTINNDKTQKQKKLVTATRQKDSSTYMKDSRTVAGINNNQVSSIFQLDNLCDFDLNTNLVFENIPPCSKKSSVQKLSSI